MQGHGAHTAVVHVERGIAREKDGSGFGVTAISSTMQECDSVLDPFIGVDSVLERGKNRLDVAFLRSAMQGNRGGTMPSLMDESAGRCDDFLDRVHSQHAASSLEAHLTAPESTSTAPRAGSIDPLGVVFLLLRISFGRTFTSMEQIRPLSSILYRLSVPSPIILPQIGATPPVNRNLALVFKRSWTARSHSAPQDESGAFRRRSPARSGTVAVE